MCPRFVRVVAGVIAGVFGCCYHDSVVGDAMLLALQLPVFLLSRALLLCVACC